MLAVKLSATTDSSKSKMWGLNPASEIPTKALPHTKNIIQPTPANVAGVKHSLS